MNLIEEKIVVLLAIYAFAVAAIALRKILDYRNGTAQMENWLMRGVK